MSCPYCGGPMNDVGCPRPECAEKRAAKLAAMMRGDVAWVVDAYDNEELGVAIIFAPTESAAREAGARELDNVDVEGVTAKREPKFDAFAPGPVPPEAQLAAGWRLGCDHCGHHVSDEGCDECAEESGTDTYPDVVVTSRDVFCSVGCHAAFVEARQIRAALKQTALFEAQSRWPAIEVEEVAVVLTGEGNKTEVGMVRFRFPGGTHEAAWVYGDATVQLGHQADMAAWEKFRADMLALRC